MPKAYVNEIKVESEQEPERTEATQELLKKLVPYMSIVPPFDYSASYQCMVKGLLPGRLLDALNVLQFLSCTVLSAQKAQRAYGVRASVLLAMALDESAFDANNLLMKGRLFGNFSNDPEPFISPQIDQWFMTRAKVLATSKRFSSAMKAKANVKQYILRLCGLGFCSDLDARDLLSNVERYELEDCDLAGLLPAGEYVSHAFEKVYDSDGVIVALKLSARKSICGE